MSDYDTKDLTQVLAHDYPEATLTLRDKIPHNYLLTKAFLTFLEVVKTIQYSAEEIREITEALLNMIPELWQDQQFKDDLERSKILIEEDVRPRFSDIPASLEFCQKNNIPITKRSLSFNYFKMINAIINLLDRRKILSKVDYKESMLGQTSEANQEDVKEEDVNELSET